MFGVLDMFKLGSIAAVGVGLFWVYNTYAIIEKKDMEQLQEQVAAYEQQVTELTDARDALAQQNTNLIAEKEALVTNVASLEQESAKQDERIRALTNSLQNSTDDLLEVYEKLANQEFERVENIATRSPERAKSAERIIDAGTQDILDVFKELTNRETQQDEEPEQ